MHGKKRLVVLANHRKARFILANGMKIQETVLCLLNRDEEHLQPLSHARVGHDKIEGDAPFFPPHSDPKEVEKEHFSHLIAKNVVAHHASYEEVILVCEPKMLGLLKKELSHHKSVKVYKTLALDEVDIEASALEEKILKRASDAD